jgi:hypothetical protein
MPTALQHMPAERADGRPSQRVVTVSAVRTQAPGTGDDGAVVGLELLTASLADRRDDGHAVASVCTAGASGHAPVLPQPGHGPSLAQMARLPQSVGTTPFHPAGGVDASTDPR